MVLLDRINLRLIDLLQKDGRTTVTELARTLQRGESTIRDRLLGLERDGVVRGYRALVDVERIGYKVRAILRMNVDVGALAAVLKRLEAVPHVVSAYFVSGAKPLRVELVARDLGDLEQVLERRIAPLPVADVETSIVIQTLVAPRPMPVVANDAPPAADAAHQNGARTDPPIVPWASP